MSNARNIASGAKFVDTAGDTMTGGLTVDAGNGNQLTLDNGGERFTQISFQHNSAQEAALWYDATDNNLVAHANAGDGFQVQTGGTATMNVDSSGRVTMPNQPMFYGTRASTQSTTGNQNASNPIEFPTSNTIILSTHWSHSNHRFTAPVTGNYMFEWGYATNQPQGQSVYRTFLWKNGSKQPWTQLRNDSNGMTGYNYASRGALLPLTANDYVHLNSSTDAGYPFYGDSTLRVHLSIFLVG